MISFLFGVAKVAWGLTKFTYKASKLGLKMAKSVGRGSWQAFKKGTKVSKSAMRVINNSRKLTMENMKLRKQPVISESNIFNKK